MGLFYFQGLTELHKSIQAHKEMMERDNDDWVSVICGDTGSGKSLLALAIFERYCDNYFKKSTLEDNFRGFANTDETWIRAISRFRYQPFRMIIHDEAVNILYGKNAITKKNKGVNILFKQIRGKLFYHIMIIPQVHRIDREFREDRIKNLIYIEKTKKARIAHYYSTKRMHAVLNELDQMNKNRADKDMITSLRYCKTKPLYSCKIPEYKGKYLELYKPKKHDNMDDAINNAEITFLGKHAVNQYDKLHKGYMLKKLLSKGYTKKQACEELKISFVTAQKYLKLADNNEETIT